MPMILISSAYLRVRNHLTLELGNDVNFLAIYKGNHLVADSFERWDLLKYQNILIS